MIIEGGALKRPNIEKKENAENPKIHRVLDFVTEMIFSRGVFSENLRNWISVKEEISSMEHFPDFTSLKTAIVVSVNNRRWSSLDENRKIIQDDHVPNEIKNALEFLEKLIDDWGS